MVKADPPDLNHVLKEEDNKNSGEFSSFSSSPVRLSLGPIDKKERNCEEENLIDDANYKLLWQTNKKVFLLWISL
jgi:hypothetical protein